MEINFKRENSGSYMEICGEPETDSFEMKMICSNNITGFLPVSVRPVSYTHLTLPTKQTV